jgi:anti-sigma factor RsiW
MMIETNHVFNQISDYVLDLLPGNERKQVERHTSACIQCRLALQQETQLTEMARSTLQIASRPDSRRLRQLMPPVPKQHESWWSRIWQGPMWHKQLVPLGLLLILLFGAWGMWQSGQNSVWASPSPTFLAATATMTDVPTATIVETETAQEGMAPLTAVATVPKQPAAVITPAPNPTPVAALPQTTFSN